VSELGARQRAKRYVRTNVSDLLIAARSGSRYCRGNTCCPYNQEEPSKMIRNKSPSLLLTLVLCLCVLPAMGQKGPSVSRKPILANAARHDASPPLADEHSATL